MPPTAVGARATPTVRAALAALAALALALPACGDGGGEDATPAGATTTAPTGGSEDSAGATTTTPALDVTIEIEVRGGSVVGGPGRHRVTLGDDVNLEVTSDTADHVHLHGYDRLLPVAPGEPAILTFTADIAGVFEIELEDSGVRLGELEVS